MYHTYMPNKCTTTSTVKNSRLSVKLNIHLIFNWQLNTNSITPLRNLKHGNDVMISAFSERFYSSYSYIYLVSEGERKIQNKK
jgi:hypothetical protein